MTQKPESHWKTSRFERFVAFLLKPFAPLTKLILGVSDEEVQAKKAEKAARNAHKAEQKVQKKADEKNRRDEKRLEKQNRKLSKKSLKRDGKTVEIQSELPVFFGPHPVEEAQAEAPRELPEFFGPHPAEKNQESVSHFDEEIASKLHQTSEALDTELPSKTKGVGLFKKLVLFATVPVLCLRYCFSVLGKISFFPKALREQIKKKGLFAGSQYYFSDFRKNRQKRAEEKANSPRYKDPLGAGDEPLELLEFRSPTVAIVNSALPPLARYIIWIFGGLVSSMILAMALLPINKIVSLKGRLISKRPLMVIQSSDQGIVLDIRAQVGDVVKKGQVVGLMDPRLSQSELEEVRHELAVYKVRVDRLKAEVADRPYVPDESNPVSLEEGKNYLHRQKDFRAELETLDEEVASRQSALQGAEASAAMYGSKLRIALELLRIRQAEQHHEVGTRLGTLQAQDAVMDTERQLIDAQKNASSARAELKGQQAKRESYLQNWKAEAYDLLSDAEVKLATAKSGYEKAKIKHELITLRAPEDGIVLSEGAIARGAVFTAGMPFMTLVPLKGGVEMEGAMSSEDSGYVKTGAHAFIKFASFPYDVYGGAEGNVSAISADSFLPDQAETENTREAVLPPGGKASLFFRVKVQISHYTLHGTPQFFHPGPGQVVTADIDVGKRTMMQYLFGNMKSTITEGMREPN